MKDKTRKLITGSFLGMINFFAVTLVSLYLMPFQIFHLGNRLYGLWLVFGSFFSYYGLFDFGLITAVERYISRAVGKNDHEEANEVFNSSLIVFFLIGILTFLLTIVASFCGQVFFSDPLDKELFRKIVLITGFGLSVGFPMRSFWAIFSSHLRWDLSIYVDLVKLVLRTFLIIFFLLKGFKLVALALIVTTTDILGHIACFIISMNIADYMKLSRKHIKKTRIKELFSYSVYSFLSRVADNLKFSIDNFVIAGFMGLGYVTLYSIATRLIAYYQHFVSNSVGLMMPVFSQYEGQNNYEMIKEKYNLIIKITIFISMFVSGILLVFSKVFIIRWVGPEYEYAYFLLLILLIPMTLYLCIMPSKQLLFGISKHKVISFLFISEALMNMVLSIILVKYYRLVGVALGTALPLFLFGIILRIIYVSKVIKVKISSFLFDNFLINLVKCSVLIVIFQFLIKKYLAPSFYLITAQVMIYMVLYFLFAFYYFSKQERDLVLNTVLKRRAANDRK